MISEYIEGNKNLINFFYLLRRMDTDVIKLIESKHEVTLLGSNLNEFCVKFYGPRGGTIVIYLIDS